VAIRQVMCSTSFLNVSFNQNLLTEENVLFIGMNISNLDSVRTKISLKLARRGIHVARGLFVHPPEKQWTIDLEKFPIQRQFIPRPSSPVYLKFN
jgi:hypothetical protein